MWPPYEAFAPCNPFQSPRRCQTSIRFKEGARDRPTSTKSYTINVGQRKARNIQRRQLSTVITPNTKKNLPETTTADAISNKVTKSFSEVELTIGEKR